MAPPEVVSTKSFPAVPVVKERPILFSAPMVRALLDGSKTQTRRVVKLPHENPLGKWEALPWGGPNGGRTRSGETVPAQMVIGHSRTGDILSCPYGQPDDRLWVRETFAHMYRGNSMPESRRGDDVVYAADGFAPDSYVYGAWKPSIHMPRWASRIDLEVTGVRVERLQDISRDDAKAEGCEHGDSCDHARLSCADIGCLGPDYRIGYRTLWEQINGPGSWDANPWVWVVEFRRVWP